ncbi:hypothetical protein AKJ09_05804 [Labilithrix luteola]|uniref:DUF4352 domain-containing protein n=1 Tax=Labilithrix luteola TaxID=1391654 RepID=A0A0K1Q029_9BACT|nr:hypothetical protein [Labilithrix luteola]AKU99140.1 hypothetical protein AKJ09_05804 [Labilithrix luteola]
MNRRSIVVLGLMIVGCSNASPPQRPEVPPSTWVSVAHGASVDVGVERALFEQPGAAHFFVHVRITNKSDAPVGVDLRNYNEVFFPNQWGASDESHRTVTDERRLVVSPLGAEAKAAIEADYRAGKLTNVQPGASVDYYRDFNASSRDEVGAQAKGARYVLVSLDGQLNVTNGTSAERVVPRPEDDARVMAIDAPVEWQRVPSNAVVIAH